MSNANFCTCDDVACPFHPKQQDNQCTACIAKNLENHEIPTCFWKKIGEETTTKSNYTFRRFAERVMSKD